MSRVGMSTLLLSPLVHPTPTWDTLGYGRQAGGPHPTGMRFCFCFCLLCKNAHVTIPNILEDSRFHAVLEILAEP